MRDTFLSFSLPLIGAEEIDEVVEALKSGWLTSGPRTRQFEQDFCQAFGSPAALSLNSCTAGLHIALKVLNPLFSADLFGYSEGLYFDDRFVVADLRSIVAINRLGETKVGLTQAVPPIWILLTASVVTTDLVSQHSLHYSGPTR